LTECDSTCNILINHVTEVAKNANEDPKPWWKFAIKAAYIRVFILAKVMEFKKPKELMEEFALPTLKRLLSHFYPDLINED